MGGFAGGSSRLARPPAVLEEPDIRPGRSCPSLVASAPYGSTAGLSDDGTILYTVSTSTLTLLNFPALSASSTVNLDPAMNALGAGGGGNIQVATLADDGYLYAAAYVTSPTNIQLFKVLLDGTSPTLLWTASTATSSADQYSIGWHPAQPNYIFLLYGTDSGNAELYGIHRSTGALLGTSGFFPGGVYLANRHNLQQYDDGFVFFVGNAGPPTNGTIYAWLAASSGNDSLAVASFGGMGTAPDGLTYWTEDAGGAVHAFTISGGPTINVTLPACDDPWGGNEVIYYIANADRTLVYVGDGLYVWSWP